MKFTFKSMFAMALLITAASCTRQDLQEPEIRPEGIIYEAYFSHKAADVKSWEDNGEVIWEYGDSVAFVPLNNQDGRPVGPIGTGIVLQEENEDENLEERAIISLAKPMTKTAAFAVMPHSQSDRGVTWCQDSDVLTVLNRDNQKGTFTEANLCAATVAEGSQTLRFHNLAAIFNFRVTDSRVKQVIISGIGLDAFIYNFFDLSTGEISETIVKSNSSPKNKITVKTPYAGTQGNIYSGHYYVSVPPLTYSRIQFDCADADGNTLFKVRYDKPITARRGTLVKWGDLSCHDIDAYLPTGFTIKDALKTAAGSLDNVKTIRFVPRSSSTEGTDIHDNTKGNNPIYINCVDGNVTFSTPAEQFQANPDFRRAFGTLYNVASIDFASSLKTDAVTNMYGLFETCNNLKELDLSTFNTANVTNLDSFLQNCSSLELVKLGPQFVFPEECTTNHFIWATGAYNTSLYYKTTFICNETQWTALNGDTDNNTGFSKAKYLWAVDLGPAGIWSAFNIGATAPEQTGYRYSWGNTEGHWLNDTSDGYNFTSEEYSSTNGTTLTSSITPDGGSDAARVNCGSHWRMPSYAGDLAEAIGLGKATWTWTNLNDVNGVRITGTGDYSGNSIFIPTGGIVADGELHSTDFVILWSSYFNSATNASYAKEQILFNASSFGNTSGQGYYGIPVRPVLDL